MVVAALKIHLVHTRTVLDPLGGLFEARKPFWIRWQFVKLAH